MEKTNYKARPTYTILFRTDTEEYLCHFLFFDPESITWTKDLNEVFCFRSHSDAECNCETYTRPFE